MATPRVVHLYTAFVDEHAAADALDRCASLLSPDERARRDRFYFEYSRREYTFAHALARLALSRHARGIAPREWTFVDGAHGRPEIAGPATAPPLAFNLSHTDGLVACIVADGAEIGVDVENAERRWSGVTLTDRYFAPSESAALRLLPVEQQRDHFFRYWTLKESYIKARGLGLALPLDAFWFSLEPEIRIAFAPSLPDLAERWRFVQRRATARHWLAVAVGEAPGAPAPRIIDGPALLGALHEIGGV